MNKFNLGTKEKDKKIITFTINKEIKEKLKEILSTSKKYNQKKKSEWVNEAIVNLSKNKEHKELILAADGIGENFVYDKIYMSFEQRFSFAKIKRAVITDNPDIKGPQAAIIRAAILSRLMRKDFE